MRAIMMSIQPKWCELIASGIKTIEVEKTKPKLVMPFKCYIYETKAERCSKYYDVFHENTIGKVIGEFVCDWINEYSAEFVDDDCYEEIRQIFEDDGEEDYCTITSNEDDNPDNCTLCIKSCLSFNDIKKYIGINFHEKRFYGWHISNLVIYDEPKELSEFCKAGFEDDYTRWEDLFTIGVQGVGCVKYPKEPKIEDYRIKRPPQSWCYVEELERE